MIREYISHYLIRSNKMYNTKFTHKRKNFHNAVIRKFSISFISYSSSFYRINSSTSRTYTITFIYLWFICPLYRHISLFCIKNIRFIYNSCRNKSYFIYISKNTFSSLSSPNNMPNFKKIIIYSFYSYRLFFK